MTDPSITKALAEVLEPCPGGAVPIPQVHGAVMANLGIQSGVSFRDVKNALRAAGLPVGMDERGGEAFARDVVLGPDVQVRPGRLERAELEEKIRAMRKSMR